jgi:hypothetical protein
MDSSFESEHWQKKGREVKREEKRAKFNDAKILRLEDMFPDLCQPKLEKKTEKKHSFERKGNLFEPFYITNLLILKFKDAVSSVGSKRVAYPFY